MELRKVANADGAPYRERAEVYAYHPQQGVYGGQWEADKTFAVPGGGIDEGEDIATAAAREFLEETGMQVKNPRLIPIDPVTNTWSERHRATLPPEKQKFHGSRTHFVLADLEDTTPVSGKLDRWPATDRRFYPVSEALSLGAGGTPLVPDVYAARKKVLAYLQSLAAPEALNKAASDHKIVNGNCGHVIVPCGDGGEHETEVVDTPCAKCIQEAANEAAEDPTDAQKESGNYKKGHLIWRGLKLTIETPKGRNRSGKDKDGKPWSLTMKDHYGYILNTLSEADGDHVDIFLCDEALDSDKIFVINQNVDGKFDEHKAVLGCNSETHAKDVYNRNYSDDWDGLHSVVEMTLPEFKDWLSVGDSSKALTKKAEEPRARTAVLVTGNPKFIGDNPKAEAFYAGIEKHLQQAGFQTSRDPGEPYTMPQPADLWIGHSRGVDRFDYAPDGQKRLAFGSSRPGAINHPGDTALQSGDTPTDDHYVVTPEMLAAIDQLIAPDAPPKNEKSAGMFDSIKDYATKNPELAADVLTAGGMSGLGALLSGISGAAEAPPGYRMEAARRDALMGGLGGLSSFAALKGTQKFFNEGRASSPVAAAAAGLGGYAFSKALSDARYPILLGLMGRPSWEVRPDNVDDMVREELAKQQKKQQERQRRLGQFNSINVNRNATKQADERVRVVMPYDGQYLLEKLLNKKYPQNLGKLRFPGGGVDAGETPEQAAVREMQEELSLKVDPAKLQHLGQAAESPEHYYQLDDHSLRPGRYKTNVGGDAFVKLVRALPQGEKYMGADLTALRHPEQEKSSSTWRKAIKLVVDPSRSNEARTWFDILLKQKPIGFMKTLGTRAGTRLENIELLDHLQGFGIGRKVLGELMQRTGKPLLSGWQVSPKAQGVFKSMAKRPGYGLEQMTENITKQPMSRQNGMQLNAPSGTDIFKLTRKQADDLNDLKFAKQMSDLKYYKAKHNKLRTMMARAPKDWEVDSKGNMYGVTHRPTGWQFHLPPRIVPKDILERAIKSASATDVARGLLQAKSVISPLSRSLMRRGQRYGAYVLNPKAQAIPGWQQLTELLGSPRIAKSLKDIPKDFKGLVFDPKGYTVADFAGPLDRYASLHLAKNVTVRQLRQRLKDYKAIVRDSSGKRIPAASAQLNAGHRVSIPPWFPVPKNVPWRAVASSSISGTPMDSDKLVENILLRRWAGRDLRSAIPKATRLDKFFRRAGLTPASPLEQIREALQKSFGGKSILKEVNGLASAPSDLLTDKNYHKFKIHPKNWSKYMLQERRDLLPPTYATTAIDAPVGYIANNAPGQLSQSELMRGIRAVNRGTTEYRVNTFNGAVLPTATTTRGSNVVKSLVPNTGTDQLANRSDELVNKLLQRMPARYRRATYGFDIGIDTKRRPFVIEANPVDSTGAPGHLNLPYMPQAYSALLGRENPIATVQRAGTEAVAKIPRVYGTYARLSGSSDREQPNSIPPLGGLQ